MQSYKKGLLRHSYGQYMLISCLRGKLEFVSKATVLSICNWRVEMCARGATCNVQEKACPITWCCVERQEMRGNT
eukprot:scaffold249010_cov17-Tisochrysis_lutea.AAC.2